MPKAVFQGQNDTYFFRPIQEFKKKKKLNMLAFSERRKLSKMFAGWAGENGVDRSPESVIAYLSTLGIINVDKAKEVLLNEESKEHRI
ncbi:MAG: hypothetical protein E7449_01025 [Ruminococcaceae bacterium]|nr:hypothetical protein [Oscillospiraceae bacterium]